MSQRKLILLPKFFLPTTGGLQNATARIGVSLAGMGWLVSAHFPAAPAERPVPSTSPPPFETQGHEGSRGAFWSCIQGLFGSDLHDTTVLAVGLEYEEVLDAQIDALCTLKTLGADVFLRVATTGDIANRITNIRAHRLAILNRIIVLNRAMEAEAMQWPALSGRVHQIPVMVDINRYRPNLLLRTHIRRSVGIAPSQPVVLCAGRLDLRKRVELVIEAMKDIDALLWIVGDSSIANADDAERYRQLARHYGVRDLRIDAGLPESEMPGLLAAADVFVTASAVEGMSNAVLEAASVGLAVVGFAIPGIEETAEALNNTGFHLVSPSTGAAGLGQALQAALALYPREGWRSLRDTTLGAFSIEQVGARWHSLLIGES